MLNARCAHRSCAMSPHSSRRPLALAIHGGAGVIEPGSLGADVETAIHAELARALDVGHAILATGGTALDAVEAAVTVLEDSPHFNAGRGSVFTAEGRHELDASIMDGRHRRAGSVAGLMTVRHPVRLARRVLEDSPHVFLIGDGAEQFAEASSACRTAGSRPRRGARSCAMRNSASSRPGRAATICAASTSARSARSRSTAAGTWRPPRPPAA